MPDRRPALTRADLPDRFTPDTVRDLPIATLRRLSDHRNGILGREEQRDFDKAVHEVMRTTATRLSQQLTPADWDALRRNERARGTRAPASRADKQLQRLARRIGQQVDLAETLAPGVDWSFARTDPRATSPTAPPPSLASTDDSTDDSTTAEATEVTDAIDDATEDGSGDDTGDDSDTVSDLERDLTDQVELVGVMTEIAEVSKRTYALEQQRDLQATRTVFFGLVVSVAVLVAGWAPLVTAHDWTERAWMITLTVVTCVLAGLVYGLVRRRQNAEDAKAAQSTAQSANGTD